jgi:hypothetical protein
MRNGPRALELAQRANQLTQGSSPWALRSLAAALAETGQFPEAIAAVEQAMRLPDTLANAALLDDLQKQLQLYQSNTAFRTLGYVRLPRRHEIIMDRLRYHYANGGQGSHARVHGKTRYRVRGA